MFQRLACAALATACVAPLAAAQESYPTRPIQVILPLQVGSASDIAVRVVAERMAELLGQNVVVENVAGDGPSTPSAGRGSPYGRVSRPVGTPQATLIDGTAPSYSLADASLSSGWRCLPANVVVAGATGTHGAQNNKPSIKTTGMSFTSMMDPG